MANSNSFQVILTSPTLELNGVNVFSVNLVRGLLERGISASILITDPHRKEEIPMEIPERIPIDQLPVPKEASWQQRWQILIKYLEDRTPCIYVPNYDWKYSSISPKLSNKVGVVGIVHSDDERHYEHANRLGDYWNAIVAVSQFTAQKTIDLKPHLSQKVVPIPIGVSIPECLPSKPMQKESDSSPINLIYAGKIKQVQKRVFDLPKIFEALQARKVPFKVKILGDGPAQKELISLCDKFLKEGIVEFTGLLSNQLTHQHLEESEVILLTSEYEGLPNVIVEAMGRGCIPIVTDIKSGISELVKDGYNGYLVPIGDIQEFANRIAFLQKNRETMNELKTNAFRTVYGSQYSVERMVDSYLDLFTKIIEQPSGIYKRKKGNVLPHPSLQNSIKSKNRLQIVWSKIVRSPRKLMTLIIGLKS